MIKNHYNHWLPKLFGAGAVVFGSHIFYVSGSPSNSLRRHEEKHVEQYKELGVFNFLIKYLTEYFSGRFHGLNHYDAYKKISFEIEAREAEKKQ